MLEKLRSTYLSEVMMLNDSRAGEARLGNLYIVHVQNQQELKSADGGVRSAS